MPTRPTRLVNPRHRTRDPDDPDHVYIGRANARYGLTCSKWGNPFKVQRDTPEERRRAIERDRRYLLEERPDLPTDLPELRGRTLYCWCAPPEGLTSEDRPYVCHGQVLAALADGLPGGIP